MSTIRASLASTAASAASPSERAAPTAASALRVINAVLNFRPSQTATTSPINDDDVFTAVSMAAGDMFFPDALMINRLH